MLILLSPAKRLSSAPMTIDNSTMPFFEKEINSILRVMKRKNAEDLKQLMNISDKLSMTNVQRFKDMKIPFDESSAYPAIYTFQGDAYLGLEAESLDKTAIQFCQYHLRILSGFYGLLKPLDLIMPYRLEMGIKLEINKHKNLYEFWGNKITNKINADLIEMESDLVVNLASNEYFAAVKPKKIKGRLLTINFKEYRKGKYQFVSFFGKKARGLMTRYIAKNKIVQAEELKGFNLEGYAYNDEQSSENNWLFSRES